MQILILISLLTWSFQQDSGSPARSSRATTAVERRQEITELIGKLETVTQGETWRYPSAETRKETSQRLLAISRESRKSRQAVIAALIETFKRDSSDRRIYIAHLLSELRAVEALDLIVGHLDHKGLFSSFSLNMRPMVDAVVGFGEAAVPYLEKALSGDRILVRKEACVALANIGGARAQKVLEKALQNESDEAVIKSIRGGLSEIAIRRQQRRSR